MAISLTNVVPENQSLRIPIKLNESYANIELLLNRYQKASHSGGTINGVDYKLIKVEGDEQPTYQAIIDYSNSNKIPNPRLVSEREGLYDIYRFIIGASLVFELLGKNSISKALVAYFECIEKGEGSRAEYKFLFKNERNSELENILTSINCQIIELFRANNENSITELNKLSVRLKKALAKLIATESDVTESQALQQLYGGMHAAFKTYQAPKQETITILDDKTKSVVTSEQGKVSGKYLRSTYIDNGNNTANELEKHFGAPLIIHETKKEETISNSPSNDDSSHDSTSKESDSDIDTSNDNNNQYQLIPDDSDLETKLSFQPFINANSSVIEKVGASSEPYDMVSGNVRNFSHNTLKTTKKLENEIQITRTFQYDTMGVVDPFKLSRFDATKKRAIAKNMLCEAFKAQLAERLKNFKELYQPLIAKQKNGKKVKFYMNYQTLLSPVLFDSLHVSEDNNQAFVNTAQQAMLDLEEEFYRQYATTKGDKDIKLQAAAKYLGITAEDLNQVELVFSHSNTPVNDLGESAWTFFQSNRVEFLKHFVTQSHIEDDNFSKQIREDKLAWVEILINTNIQDIFENSLTLKIQEIVKAILEKGKIPKDHQTIIDQLIDFSNLKTDKEDHKKFAIELHSRLTATVKLYLLEQKASGYAPQDYKKRYHYYQDRSAAEALCVGQAGSTIIGCKSGRDRTAVMGAVIEAAFTLGKVCPVASDGLTKKLINGGHYARKIFGGQSRRPKLDDVDKSGALSDKNGFLGTKANKKGKKNVRFSSGLKQPSNYLALQIAEFSLGALIGLLPPLLSDIGTTAATGLLDIDRPGSGFRRGYFVGRVPYLITATLAVGTLSTVAHLIYSGVQTIDKKLLGNKCHLPNYPHFNTMLINYLAFIKEKSPEHENKERLSINKSAFLNSTDTQTIIKNNNQQINIIRKLSHQDTAKSQARGDYFVNRV